jgi:DNA-binding Lrp family transcriptional regulator
LLYALDVDSSWTLGVLARALRRSKQFVLYRMRKLEEEGVITGYHAIVDMSRLGYFTFRIYFKFQQMTQSGIDAFITFARKLPQIWTITSIQGKWDCALFLGVRSVEDFHRVWDALLLEHKRHIKAYNVAVYAPIHNFNKKFFIGEPKDVVERIYGAGEAERIDDGDLRIIRAYAGDVRQPLAAIARRVGVSADIVRRRIRALEERKIIVGYTLGLNLGLLGHTGYRVDVQLLSTRRNRELFEYCRAHPNIYQVNRSIGGADFEFEVIVRDLAHLIRIIDEIKTRFEDVVSDVEYFGFSAFYALKYIPD